eukprot:scaffold144651_cov40-Prasinocladus_malaysianus.AAC.1
MLNLKFTPTISQRYENEYENPVYSYEYEYRFRLLAILCIKPRSNFTVRALVPVRTAIVQYLYEYTDDRCVEYWSAS